MAMNIDHACSNLRSLMYLPPIIAHFVTIFCTFCNKMRQGRKNE